MAPKLIFLTGAPEASSLTWGSEAGLLNSFEEPVARFARLNKPLQTTIEGNTQSSSTSVPYWRSIPLERQHLPTGLSQNIWREEYQGAQFFATSNIDNFIGEYSQGEEQASLQSVEDVLTQFYEESYGVHQDIPSSQIDAVSQASISFVSDGTSYNSTFDSLASPRRELQNIPASGQLSNLKDIPNANYLSSINPQTVTVNLVVGLISVPSPRDIKTKRGANVNLVELIVGDESKTGFGVNFWLSNSQNQKGEMEKILDSLRPQDVVLMRNVALSSFRGRVYGQSLRKDVTKVHLLYRKRIDRTDVGGCYSTADLDSEERGNLQVEKTKRVREWVQMFVGGPVRKGKGVEERFREVLPPDSLPSQI